MICLVVYIDSQIRIPYLFDHNDIFEEPWRDKPYKAEGRLQATCDTKSQKAVKFRNPLIKKYRYPHFIY